MLPKIFTRDVTAVRPEDGPDSIGQIAVERQYITREDLAEALCVQRQRMKLGQILVDLGKLTEEQLGDLLLEQRIRRGEKISAAEMHRHERRKLHRRIGAVGDVFKSMGAEARGLANSVTESMNGRLEKV